MLGASNRPYNRKPMPAMTQDYRGIQSVRAATILTNAFVAGTILTDLPLENQLIILIKFTIGSLTDGQIKVEFSSDGGASNYYQESFSSISTGTDTLSLGIHKMTASGNYRIAVPIKDGFVKISAIGTGDVTASSMTIDACIGVS